MDFSLLGKIGGPLRLEQLSSGQLLELQLGLAAIGYVVAGDGILGPQTRAAWASFKTSQDLNLPDMVGPDSIARLERSVAAWGMVPPPAVAIVKAFEGYSAVAYDDGVGVWTIGYGTTVYPDGQAVRPGDAITAAQAETFLSHDLAGTQAVLARSVPFWTSMDADQHASLLSFAYNLGASFYGTDGFNTLSTALEQHRWADVPQILLLYSDPGTAVHAGLLRRRQAEAELWQGKGSYASS